MSDKAPPIVIELVNKWTDQIINLISSKSPEALEVIIEMAKLHATTFVFHWVIGVLFVGMFMWFAYAARQKILKMGSYEKEQDEITHVKMWGFNFITIVGMLVLLITFPAREVGAYWYPKGYTAYYVLKQVTPSNNR
jgi:hypothetical protein